MSDYFSIMGIGLGIFIGYLLLLAIVPWLKAYFYAIQCEKLRKEREKLVYLDLERKKRENS